MDLGLVRERASPYKSPSQKARALTEGWAADQLYCPACRSKRLGATPPGTAVVDFHCRKCGEPFQLKSSQARIGSRISDAGYSAMMAAIRANRTPNLLVLRYSFEQFRVSDLLLVPRFLLTESAIERRAPLKPTARRAGWVGCNIVLGRIPDGGRIAIVHGGVEADPHEVRKRFDALRPLAEIALAHRSWTLDVLRVVSGLRKAEFLLSDVYGFEKELQQLHPSNRHVRDKIRQQLQVLRDLGWLRFVGRGRYLLSAPSRSPATC